MFLRAAAGAGIVALGIGFGAAPALADEPAPATAFDALTDRVTEPVAPGGVAGKVLGVGNVSKEPVAGAVVNIRALNDADLLGQYDNCWYYQDSNVEGAWCEFDEVLTAGETYAIAGPMIQAAAEPTYQDESSLIVFRWYTRETAEQNGGVEALARRDNVSGEVRQGTGRAVDLEARTLALREKPNPIGLAYIKVTRPSPQPSASVPPSEVPSSGPTSTAPAPTGSASASASAPTPADPGPVDDGGEGGGLPVTGSAASTAAGVGAGLLLAGGIGYAVARRRRTRFVA
jgi:LPXTG-motif cell wall-anchored protein